jgi:hypothetical protein
VGCRIGPSGFEISQCASSRDAFFFSGVSTQSANLQHQPLENSTRSAVQRENDAKTTANILHPIKSMTRPPLKPIWWQSLRPSPSGGRGGEPGLVAFRARTANSRLPLVANTTFLSSVAFPVQIPLSFLLECVEVPHSLWVLQLQAGRCSHPEAPSRGPSSSHSFVSFFSSTLFVPRRERLSLSSRR